MVVVMAGTTWGTRLTGTPSAMVGRRSGSGLGAWVETTWLARGDGPAGVKGNEPIYILTRVADVGHTAPLNGHHKLVFSGGVCVVVGSTICPPELTRHIASFTHLSLQYL